MVKDWDGFMGGSRFKSQCGQHMEKKTIPVKKKIQGRYVDLEGK